MKHAKWALGLALLLVCAAFVAAQQAPPAPAKEGAPEIESPQAPGAEGEKGAQPAVEPLPAEAPPAETPPAEEAPDRQAQIYQDYERLVRVMDIVESRYVEPVDSDQLFEGAIRGIMNSLDPYSAYVPPDAYKEFMEETEQQFSGVGITIAVENDRIKVVSTIEGMPAFRAGVQPGDFILKVEDKTVEEIGPLDEVARRLRGAIGSSVTVVFFRPSTGKEFALTLVREDIPITTLRGYRADAKTGKWDFMIDPADKVGYIRVTKFSQNTAKELDEAYQVLVAQGLRGLVMDLRFNPGGLLDSAVAVADRFIDDGLIVRTQGRAGIHNESYARPYDTYRPPLPLVLLVNQYTASAGEVLGGALKDHERAVLVGTRTFGKGSVQNIIDLDGHGAIKLTIAYYYTPKGKLVHRVPNAKEWGLEPDVVQQMSPEDTSKVLEQWGQAAGGKAPTLLGEGGTTVLDMQLSRGLDILRGMLMSAKGVGEGGK